MIALGLSRKVHFVGVGGIGMSALAEMLHAEGYTVSGSDMARSVVARRLAALGVDVRYGHDASHVGGAHLVVYSSAVGDDNPELRAARDEGIPCMRRAEMLSEMIRSRYAVCICGTHGKTTTTAMMGKVLADGGLDPTVLIGGIPRDAESNLRAGEGRVCVTEADEYDRSFLALWPSLVVLTNIEAEHTDCYRNLDELKDTFTEFCGRVPFHGAVLFCSDDPGAVEVTSRLHARVIGYGLDERAEYRATEVACEGRGRRFRVVCRGRDLGQFRLDVPGLHNVRNALAAIACAAELHVPAETIATSIASFSGVKRRMEPAGEAGGVAVYDDYAHHPSEIRATVQTGRDMGYGRIIAAFQPHLYTRTRDFLDQFAEALTEADRVYVLPIYAARERKIPGIDSRKIVERMKQKGYGSARFVSSADRLAEYASVDARKGDAVILMGAGDIGERAGEILGRLGRETNV